MQSTKAPTPGSTIWRARESAAGSEVTSTLGRPGASAAARSNAFAAERKFPEP